MMNLPLVHGWIASGEIALALEGKGYNQLQESMIRFQEAKETGGSELQLSTGAAIEHFLQDSASQLTYEGLVQLHAELEERAVAVFFRNNHFSTLVKVSARQYQGCVFLLATDEGFKEQSKIVWEKLNEVSGDTMYCNSDFEEVKLDDQTSEQATMAEINRIQEADLRAKQETEDLELARKMQTEMNLASQPNSRPPPRPKSKPEAAARAVPRPDRPPPVPVSVPQPKQKKRNSSCSLS